MNGDSLQGGGNGAQAGSATGGHFAPIQIGGNANNIGQDISNLAPLATSWGGPSVGVDTQQVVRNTYQAQPSDLSKFGSFLGDIATQTGHMAAQAASWLGSNIESMGTGAVRWGAGLANKFGDAAMISNLNTASQQNSDLLNNTMAAYKSGQMSKDGYLRALNAMAQNADNIDSQTRAANNRLNLDQQQAVQGMIDTGSLIVTLLSGGFGKAGDLALSVENGAMKATVTDSLTSRAADWLGSTAAKPFLSGTSDFISRVASQPDVYNALSDSAKLALQRSTAEVLAQGTTMTAQQIARATAANVALKYPLTYGFLEPSATDLYHQLDNKQYGAAVQNVAFNALLLLSGGVIGQALKYGGKILGAISDRTFGQTSFWDNLSGFFDKGQPSGFRDAAQKIADAIDNPAANQDFINSLSSKDRAVFSSYADGKSFMKDLSAVEAVNMASAGNDAVAAANRVATGLTTAENLDLTTVTHTQALLNQANWVQAQRLADQTAQDFGLGKVAVGRVDARDLNGISAEIAPLIEGGDKQAAHDALNNLAQQNQTRAWANNSNFMQQLHNLIDTSASSSTFDQSVRDIKAQFSVKGFPRSVASKLSAMGYIPIKPVVNEAPFREGTGNLISSFAQSGDLWTKAVKPLPILDNIGYMLTSIGMSPQNATQQVYDMYNKNLAENLANSSYVKDLGMVGETPAQTSDTIIKKLSDYAHNPTSGGIPLTNGARIRAPISDLRQLTTKDIMTALETDATKAKEIAGALMDSMIQVPLEIRGLGGKIEDLNIKYNPTAKFLSRTQGAARFAWNPFFQMKLAYKTEALSQLQAGGKFPTILGTNTILSMIFPDHYAQLDEIRGTLRDAGIFDKKAVGQVGVVSGEGVNDITSQSANLTHTLLPTQERSIAGLIATQADKAGMAPQQFIQQFPSQVRDTVQMIAQYDRNNSFLNSPMARTLNFAFFPFRFETKVATVMATSLAKTSVGTQFAVIKGLYNGSQFLNSPQGQAWYSQNAQALQLLQYFTPLSTLNTVSNILGGKADSVGSFGELGGLPLGWIPQLLDSEGISQKLFGKTLTQSAYLDAKTGQEIPNYVPATARGALLIAIQDLVGTLFTYPGATAGLPSKAGFDRNLALEVTGSNKKQDLQQNMLPLSPSQQQYQQSIQASNGTSPSSALTPLTAPSPTPGIPVPVQSTPLSTPLPKSTAAPRLKKSQFRPAPLPKQ